MRPPAPPIATPAPIAGCPRAGQGEIFMDGFALLNRPTHVFFRETPWGGIGMAWHGVVWHCMGRYGKIRSRSQRGCPNFLPIKTLADVAHIVIGCVCRDWSFLFSFYAFLASFSLPTEKPCAFMLLLAHGAFSYLVQFVNI